MAPTRTFSMWSPLIVFVRRSLTSAYRTLLWYTHSTYRRTKMQRILLTFILNARAGCFYVRVHFKTKGQVQREKKCNEPAVTICSFFSLSLFSSRTYVASNEVELHLFISPFFFLFMHSLKAHEFCALHYTHTSHFFIFGFGLPLLLHNK